MNFLYYMFETNNSNYGQHDSKSDDDTSNFTCAYFSLRTASTSRIVLMVSVICPE